MKRGTTEHPKFKRLRRRLGCGIAQAVGHLELLWHLAARCAQDGGVGRYHDEEIAEECGWEGDAEAFVAALVECRWLDEVAGVTRLVVHAWPEHCDDTVHRSLARARATFADGSPPRWARLQHDGEDARHRAWWESTAAGVKRPEFEARSNGRGQTPDRRSSAGVVTTDCPWSDGVVPESESPALPIPTIPIPTKPPVGEAVQETARAREASPKRRSEPPPAVPAGPTRVDRSPPSTTPSSEAQALAVWWVDLRAQHDPRAIAPGLGRLSDPSVRASVAVREAEAAQILLDRGLDADEVRELAAWAMERRSREGRRVPWGTVLRSLVDLAAKWDAVRADWQADAATPADPRIIDPWGGIPIWKPSRRLPPDVDGKAPNPPSCASEGAT